MTRPAYIMVPRKLIASWIIAYLTLMVMVAVAVQWANYVDKRSNQRLCGLVVIFDDANREKPPVAERQVRVALEFRKLRKEFKCR